MKSYNPEVNVLEVQLTGTRNYPYPVRDVALTAIFHGQGDEQRTVEAFWDGDQIWRVRFSPPFPGDWSFVTECSEIADTGLHAQSGHFTVPPYAGNLPQLSHGAIGLSEGNLSLVHADGTHFFWLADTAWNGVLKADLDDWNYYLDSRKKQGFTAVQAVITQWRSFPADSAGQTAFNGVSSIDINPDFYKRIDAKMAAIAAHGLVPAPVLLWAYSPKDPGYYLSAEDCALLARYEVARYSAYRPIWILGGDGEYRGEASEKWKHIGRAVFGDKPDELVTMHPGGINWPGEDLRSEPWLSFHSYQSGHGDKDEDLRWLQTGPPASNWMFEPLKPVINLEPNYEHHTSYHQQQVFKAYHVRRACYWSLLVSPTAGVTYGHHGVWPWMDDSGIPPDHENSGEAPSWRDALLAEGAEAVLYLRKFFESIDWWKLRPAQDLLGSQPGDQDPNRFIAAACEAEGSRAVIYTPTGDEVQLTRELSNAQWFDPRNGVWIAAGAGTVFEPPDEQDWALVGQWAASSS